MKLRTRIGLLPASAAAVFVLGLLVTLFAGNRTLAGLQDHNRILTPSLAALNRIDDQREQFRLTLQNAASEGDVEGLKAVEPIVAAADKTLGELAALPGRGDRAAALKSAFHDYSASAIAATRAMLTRQPPGELVSTMQKRQAVLEQLQERELGSAKDEVEASEQAAAAGVARLMMLSVASSVLVLVVLGIASWWTVRAVWRELGAEPAVLRAAARRVAEGDLAVDVSTHEPHSLAAAVVGMIEKLRMTVGTIRAATESIGTASSEIATGNQDLSTRTEHTASNLQHTASSMVQLTATVRQNAESAQQANRLTDAAAQAAGRGGAIMTDVVANMTEIQDASRRIADITGVIDSIAFQTNILALNAAVEAARAGEQGRGFAVVASEVRTLAQRSAQAAREIKSLIGASGEKVEKGHRLVRDAGDRMEEIVSGVGRVMQIIAEISTASTEQSSGIGQVNSAVAELEQLTQQNAALVEQSAAAASSLQQQAVSLAGSVAAFRLRAEAVQV